MASLWEYALLFFITLKCVHWLLLIVNIILDICFTLNHLKCIILLHYLSCCDIWKIELYACQCKFNIINLGNPFCFTCFHLLFSYRVNVRWAIVNMLGMLSHFEKLFLILFSQFLFRSGWQSTELTCVPFLCVLFYLISLLFCSRFLPSILCCFLFFMINDQ